MGDRAVGSRLVEFNRFGKLDKGILREGDFYLVAQGAEPVYPFVMTLDHDEYLDMVKALSYRTKKDPREAAKQAIAEVVTAMLRSDSMELPPADHPLQLDLVVNAAELGALQFELARGPDGEPLLAREDATVVLTRRVRGAFAEQRMSLPVTPRVLFAWASPSGAGAEVPHEEHAGILRGALEPWIGPDRSAPTAAEGTAPIPADERDVLTILDQVTVADLHATLQAAVDEGRPFSHVHFLAHGYPIGREHQKHFGIVLHDENLELQEVEPDELVEALAPIGGTSATVTLATCESGSEANTLIAKRSIAHQLHVAGVPVVVGSQLPLTMPGSSILIGNFYRDVLGGVDVRLALHDARLELCRNQDVAHHDWASVVSYASLPEGYADHLSDVRLQRTLSALKTAQNWSDELLRREVTDPEPYDRIEAQLRERTADLQSAVSGAVSDEHAGLLGSAEKRFAELCRQRARLDHPGDWTAESRSALERSREWYSVAARQNLSHHWTNVQALSLEAVLDGAIAEPGMWHAAVQAATIAGGDAAEYWAFGSLAELHLLAPLAGTDGGLDEAVSALRELTERVAQLPESDLDRTFAVASTRRQLSRYAEWWTNDAGYFPGRQDLSGPAAQLVDTLPD